MKIGTTHLTEILDHAREIVYVIDMETYELLYANERAREWKGNRALVGLPCYKAMNRLDEKCPWCFIPKMENGEVHFEEAHVPGTGMWLQIDAYEVEWQGRRAAFIYSIDITRQKQQQQIYAAAVEQAQLSLFEYDMANHRITMTDSRYTEETFDKFNTPHVIENVPDSIVEMFADEDVPGLVSMYKALDAGAPQASCEVWYKTRPGQETRCEQISYMTMYDEEGEPLCAYGTGRNITVQKLEEQKFARMYAELAKLIPGSLGSFRLNLTKNTCGNGQSHHGLVLKQQESGTADGYLEESSRIIARDDYSERFLSTFNRTGLIEAYRNGETRITLEYPVHIPYPSGSIHWIEGSIQMAQNPATGDIEAVTTGVDITDRVVNREIMRHEVEYGCDFIGIIDPDDGTFELRNGRWLGKEIATVKKYDYEECRELLLNRCVDSGDADKVRDFARLDKIVEGLQSRAELIISYRFQVEDERPCRKQMRLSWLDDLHNRIILVQSDITEAYEAEMLRSEQLTAALEAAEHANAAEQVFLSSMSHDMRTPLSGIIGFTDLAKRTDDIERKQAYLDKIESSSNLMLDLVNDVLDMSKIESGKFELNLQAFEPRGLFETVVESVRVSADDRGIALLAQVDQAIPRFIKADRLRMQQIALNLLSNAVKYTPDNGTVSFEVRALEHRDDGCNLLIEVGDDGIGMSREFQSRMFEPFSQEHQSRMYGTQGTGLGLSIVKRVVDLMGGHIEVESELGQGSTFSVFLPVEVVEIGQATGRGVRGKTESIAGMRILLCEDNELNSEIARTILKERGQAESDLAINGQIGLERFEASAPGYYDAVLMDLRMPVMNGIEATEAIRALDRPDAKTVPIIAMTADAFDEDVQRCLDAGMNAHVAKPINPEKLFEVLGECRLPRDACPIPPGAVRSG